MGGRGTYSAGISVPFTFQTVGRIGGVKVLQGFNGKHGLPEESHSSNAYIQLNPDGSFKSMRIYNKKHEVAMEIAYHIEPSLDPSRNKILHYHTYGKGFEHKKAKPLTEKMKKRFSKYFVGVNYD